MLPNLIRVTRSRRFLNVLQANTSALQTHSRTDYSMGTVLCFKTEKKEEGMKNSRREGKARRGENEKETERNECVSGIFKVVVELTKSSRHKSGRVVASSASPLFAAETDDLILPQRKQLPSCDRISGEPSTDFYSGYTSLHSCSRCVLSCLDGKCQSKLPFLCSFQRTHPPAVGKRFYIIKK